jgi:hypothetical protein
LTDDLLEVSDTFCLDFLAFGLPFFALNAKYVLFRNVVLLGFLVSRSHRSPDQATHRRDFFNLEVEGQTSGKGSATIAKFCLLEKSWRCRPGQAQFWR